MLPGSTVVREEILPRDMTDIEWGGAIDGGTSAVFVDAATRAYENAIPDGDNPYYVKPDGVRWYWTINPETNQRERISQPSEYKARYVERIEGTDPDFPAGVAQWWFYWNGEYLGTFIQDTLSQIPQLIQTREGKSDLVYRIDNYNENVQTAVTIDLEEWYHVASELRKQDPEAWVINADQGWSPFLQNYGVFPSVTDELGNTPQTGTWSALIKESGDYYFEIQADNQGSITLDVTF